MMKKSEILACLKACDRIDGYEVSLIDKDSRELFYVLDHMEINRAVKVRKVTVKVYVNGKNSVGSSNVIVTAADDEKTLSKKLRNAAKSAKAAQNPYFPLSEKGKDIRNVNKKKRDLNKIATKVAKAVFKADTHSDGWINSTEIFVSEYKEEFLNSNGVDHVNESFRIEVEVIPTWRNGKEEYELYRYIRTDKEDYKKITEEVEAILDKAKARSKALTLKDVKLPEDIDILVKEDMLEYLVENFADDLNYRSAFLKSQHYKKGDLISNTPFDLTMRPVVSGCSASSRFDSHGTVLSPVKLIKAGKANGTFGDIQFGYYNKEKKISGDLKVAQLDAEGVDYKKRPHLIIEYFSAPQLESDSGYWGGEVRLARYFDGKKYIPLTGFSISGNIFEDIKDVRFSRKQTVSTRYKGPEYMIFKGLKIA